jgi:hypothetical protein
MGRTKQEFFFSGAWSLGLEKNISNRLRIELSFHTRGTMDWRGFEALMAVGIAGFDVSIVTGKVNIGMLA